MGTMKRMAWHSRDSYKLTPDEVPIPKTPEKGALIKILFTGICRSDLSSAKDDLMPHKILPLVFGHEICGQIQEFGSSVNKDSIQVSLGQTVLVYGPAGCGDCSMCQAGSRFCLGDKENSFGLFYGLGTDGGFAEYMVVQEVKHLVPIPDGIPYDLAALLGCGGLAAFNAVDETRRSIDERIKGLGKATLLVVGSGGLGSWATQIARSIWGSSLQICVADITEEKLALAKENGADVTVLWGADEEATTLAQRTREVCCGGIDACTDFVNITTTFAAALLSLNRNGTLAMVGVTKNATLAPMPQFMIPLHSIRLIGIFMGSKDQLQCLMELVAQKKVKGPPVTRVTLFEINDVFDKLLKSALSGRAVVDMEKTFSK